jgi:hypothetical protein
MILFLVFLEAILFTIEQFDIHTTDIALRLFVSLTFLGLFTNLSEFIDDDGT